ncbi:hypothetical protein [Peribacillus frigoritolerans]|uniref:hypothetical protein n=1 Tax=Peribacillus frigoritolerans TaxID=450367 RepID=UPI002E1A1387|nr:hypothetical protein [Peribacillus frigoritolerans]
MIKRVQYNSDIKIVFSSSNSDFYKEAINKVINNGDSWIDIAVYNITHDDLIKLKNICDENSIYLRVITNEVKKGVGNYNDNNCEIIYLEQTHCKIFLSKSYGYIGSFNFTFKDYPDIQCGVEFCNSVINNRVRNEIFEPLIYNSHILIAEKLIADIEKQFVTYKKKFKNKEIFISKIERFEGISESLMANTTECLPQFDMSLFKTEILEELNINENINSFSVFLRDIKKFVCNVKTNKFIKKYKIPCGDGASIELYKDSNNWYKNLLLPSYTEEEFIRISTLNFNLSDAQRGPQSLYSIITELGKKDVFISIDFTIDQCKTVEDYRNTEIGQLALLSKLKNNHSKVFLSSYYLHIGSANFSLGSEKNFECGVTLTKGKVLKKFENDFFIDFIDISKSVWNSKPIISESSIARDVLNSIDYFFNIIRISDYYEKEEVTNKLRRVLTHASIKHFENLVVDLSVFQDHGYDASFITFDIKSFVYDMKSDKSTITDGRIEEFISYLDQLYDFLVIAEGSISQQYSKYGVLDKRYLLGEN